MNLRHLFVDHAAHRVEWDRRAVRGLGP
jgi:hypothetical protein